MNNYERMSSCPSFINCNTPICPLDIEQDLRIRLPNEEKCKANKFTRLKLGKDLPKLGFTNQEYSGGVVCHGSREALIHAIFLKFPTLKKNKKIKRGLASDKKKSLLAALSKACAPLKIEVVSTKE